MPSVDTNVALAGGGVLAGRLAERRGVALDVEQSSAIWNAWPTAAPYDRARRAPRVRLPEDAAGAAGEAQQRAGLHRLQRDDLVLGQRALRLEASLRREIEQSNTRLVEQGNVLLLVTTVQQRIN